MRYAIRHRTLFRYAHPVSFARCNLRLQPVAWMGQHIESFDLTITPHARIIGTRPIGYIGHVTRMVVDRPASELVIEGKSRLRVERVIVGPSPSDPSVSAVAAMARASFDLSPEGPVNYLYRSPMIDLVPAITEWCAADIVPERGIIEAVFSLTRRITAEFVYDGHATSTDTSPAEGFEKRRGVCQDFAQIMIAGLRGLGLPAAYVSGYLRTIPPPGKKRLVGADATHAWVMVWCGPRLGWIGFDPTNSSMVGSDHIITAMGRDYADVSPIDGIFLGIDGQKIDVSVDVAPIEEGLV